MVGVIWDSIVRAVLYAGVQEASQSEVLHTLMWPLSMSKQDLLLLSS